MIDYNTIIPAHLHRGITPTGSRFICDPPVEDTDIDYVVYSKNIGELITWLREDGFTQSTQDNLEYEITDSGMECFRKGVVNLIVVDNLTMYARWKLATALAKDFNLLNKADRINLFQAVLYPIEEF